MPQISPEQRFEIEQRFLESLRHHLAGLQRKVECEFSRENFERELAALEGDSVYSKFALDSPEYVLVRFMGRVSVSIGRRLGEIYDKIPRLMAAARFGLNPDQVAPLLQNLELDIALRFGMLRRRDVQSIQSVVRRYLNVECGDDGLGLEIRYNFNPNDSARLRKDALMAKFVRAENLRPIYLVYSGISPRDEAIKRLERAGWIFVIGSDAINFSRDLLGFDIESILDQPVVAAELKRDMDTIMSSLMQSYAFKAVINRHG